MKYFLLLLSLTAFSASFDTSKYIVEFDGYLITDLEDDAHAVKRQINHSMGPLQNLKYTGKRASLGHKYTFEVISSTPIDSKLRKLSYHFKGELLVEENVDLDSFKVVVPIRTLATFKKAQSYRGSCGSNGRLDMFYYNWSPYYKRCGLKKGEDYEEFTLTSFTKVQDLSSHISDEFLVNGEYNLFYYFGSDYFSNRKFGYAQNGFNETIRLFKRAGFNYFTDLDETQRIFDSKKLYSRYRRLKGKINGKSANVFIVLANPTETTPGTKYEFFKFFKYAFKNASSIQYSGHAGLGSVLDFDALEKEYNEKIEYAQNQKQMIYLDGCNTYFYSNAFFFSKKKLANSLVLVSNAATILTMHYKQAVNVLFDFLQKDRFNNAQVVDAVNYFMRRAKLGEYQMLDVSSN